MKIKKTSRKAVVIASILSILSRSALADCTASPDLPAYEWDATEQLWFALGPTFLNSSPTIVQVGAHHADAMIFWGGAIPRSTLGTFEEAILEWMPPNTHVIHPPTAALFNCGTPVDLQCLERDANFPATNLNKAAFYFDAIEFLAYQIAANSFMETPQELKVDAQPFSINYVWQLAGDNFSHPDRPYLVTRIDKQLLDRLSVGATAILPIVERLQGAPPGGFFTPGAIECSGGTERYWVNDQNHSGHLLNFSAGQEVKLATKFGYSKHYFLGESIHETGGMTFMDARQDNSAGTPPNYVETCRFANDIKNDPSSNPYFCTASPIKTLFGSLYRQFGVPQAGTQQYELFYLVSAFRLAELLSHHVPTLSKTVGFSHSRAPIRN